jgi:Uma2 family endonuclease
MSAHPVPRLTPERYLEIERGNDFRSEYYDGQMYAMSGGSLHHAFLISRFSRLLGNALANSLYEVVTSELLVRASQSGPFMYPDVMAICDEPKLADEHQDVLLNPTLVVEVLSKSTEAHDRGQKFAYYRQIESLKEYILLFQTEPRAEAFFRQADGEWSLKEYAGPGASCVCRSVHCELPLAEVYDRLPPSRE